MSESFEGGEFSRSIFEGIPEQCPMRSPSNELYEFGPCRLDAGQRVLTREHQRVPLAPKTFDLLLLLVRSPGRAFSKQELMTALWPETFVEEANLSFQISDAAEGTWRRGVRVDRNRPEAWVSIRGGRRREPSRGCRCPRRRRQRPRRRFRRPRSRNVWRLATGLVVGLAILASGYLALVQPRPTQRASQPDAIATPLTTYTGC